MLNNLSLSSFNPLHPSQAQQRLGMQFKVDIKPNYEFFHSPENMPLKAAAQIAGHIEKLKVQLEACVSTEVFQGFCGDELNPARNSNLEILENLNTLLELHDTAFEPPEEAISILGSYNIKARVPARASLSQIHQEIKNLMDETLQSLGFVFPHKKK
jgi:hypothetical protein